MTKKIQSGGQDVSRSPFSRERARVASSGTSAAIQRGGCGPHASKGA